MMSIPSYVYRVVVLLDGKPVAEFGGDWDEPTAAFQTRSFANGMHKVKLIYVCESNFYVSTPTVVCFRNEISVLNSPLGFRAGKSLSYYGLVGPSDPNTYLLEVYDINNVAVFSQECEGSLDVQVPGSVLSDPDGLYWFVVSRTEPNTEASLLASTSPSPSPWDILIKEPKTEPFDRKDKKHQKGQILISIGTTKAQQYAEAFWASCWAAARIQGMRPIVLTSPYCTWENLTFCLALPKVKMWYHVGDGHHHLPDAAARECIEVKDRQFIFSYLAKDGVVPPTSYRYMGERYEKMHSVAEIPSLVKGKLIWVQFDACHSGRNAEFPQYLGMLSGGPFPIGDKIFIGWSDRIYFRHATEKYDQFEQNYWFLLSGGMRLNEVLDDLTMWRIPGYANIKDNIEIYGIGAYLNARFRYAGIN